MSEKEQQMAQEIEQLRRELAELRKDRDSLHKHLCSMIPVDRTEITPEQFEEMAKRARTVDEVLRDLLPPDFYEEVRGRKD
jgi:SMC interacting uncharacterized protein involved in chromosome segregation